MKKRLSKLCDLVEGQVVADIGCDHGFLCEMLIEKGCSEIYACEVTQKNLDKARANITNYVNRNKENIVNYNDEIHYDGGKVSFILSDGFKNLHILPECAIIAGMGGELILNILFENKEKMPEHLVLQPMSKVEKLRKELSNYYTFVEDKILYDCGKYYNIMKLTKGKDILTDLQITFGKTNLELMHKDFKDYLANLKMRICNIKTEEYEKLKSKIEKVEEEYE